MKGKLINKELFYLKNRLTLGKEYFIYGIEGSCYYIIDDYNNFIYIGANYFELTDNETPNFWLKDPQNNDRILPSEWHYENFLFLNEGLEDFSNNEIWINTQFLKGLLKNYKIENLPNNLISANDDIAKTQIINSILKSYEDFSNQYRDNGSPYLDCSFYDFKAVYENRESGIISNIEHIEFKDIEYENEKGFIENIMDILSDIISYPKIEKQSDNSELILKRLAYSIWSVFQTKDVKIIMRKHNHSYPEFILKTDEKCFKLSVYLDY